MLRAVDGGRQLDGVGAVEEPQVTGDAALIEAALADPADSSAAYDTIDRLRASLDDVGDGQALVGGNTAVNLDVQNASQRDNRVIIPLIMLVVLPLFVSRVPHSAGSSGVTGRRRALL